MQSKIYPFFLVASTKCLHWSPFFSLSLSIARSLSNSWSYLTSLFISSTFTQNVHCFVVLLGTSIFLLLQEFCLSCGFSLIKCLRQQQPPSPPHRCRCRCSSCILLFRSLLLISLSLEPWSVASRRSMAQRQRVQCWQKTESCGKINIAQNFSPPTHLQLLRTYTTRTVPQPPGPAFCFGLALMMYALWKELSKVVFRVWWANVDPGNISSHLSLSRDVSFYHSPCLSTSALRCVFAFRWLHNKVINGLQWGFNYAISAIWIWMIFWLFALASCWALLSERLVSYRKLKQRENGKTK